MEEILFMVAGMIAGGTIVWLWMRGSKQEMKARLQLLEKNQAVVSERLEKSTTDKENLLRENERLKENIRQTELRFEQRKQEFDEANRLMKDQFRNLAADILEDKSRRFTEANRENMARILDPLSKDIQEFRKKVEETYHRESTDRTLLERKIAELVQLNNQVRIDAVNLTNALKGNTKVQGDWGEMILERILENSGLTKGREYYVQPTLRDGDERVIRSENGMAMRPDVVVVYPDGRKVIVDAKVSLTAYLNYCNADSDAERQYALQAHLQSVKKHIDELSGKNYCDWCEGTLDFVMMFIPNESSYILAMQQDPALWNEAYRKRVLLLSPANLIVSLKLTSDLWSREYQNRNALEIADRGARLYDKCVAFLESLIAIGDNIRRTQESYNQALGRLKEGNGNLISQTLKLKELGIKSRKTEKELPEIFR